MRSLAAEIVYPWYSTLDWRLCRARFLLEVERRPGRRDDQWTRLAWRYESLLARFGAAIPARHLRGNLAALHHAYQIHQENRRPRWLVEAGLLTGESLADTAARAQVDEVVVAAYEAAFFSVRSRLNARDFIALRALPRRACLGADRRDVAGLLKLTAWKAGPLGLETAARVLLGEPVTLASPTSCEELRRVCSDLGCLIGLVLECLPLSYFLPPHVGVLNKLCQCWAGLQCEIEAMSLTAHQPWPTTVAEQMDALNGVVRQVWSSLVIAA
jgi:hypothetical protein